MYLVRKMGVCVRILMGREASLHRYEKIQTVQAFRELHAMKAENTSKEKKG